MFRQYIRYVGLSALVLTLLLVSLPVQAQTGSVSGTVRDTSNAGIANVRISIDFFAVGQQYEACTNGDGTYSFSGLPLDTPARVFAESNTDFCTTSNYVREFWNETPWWYDASNVTLTSGNPSVTGIDFTLELGGTIYGRITDEAGTTPLPSGWADAFRTSDNADFSDGFADSNGYYEITVPAGEYIINARATDAEYEWYNDAGPSWDNANAVTVTVGGSVNTVDFHLGPSGTISGQVKDEFGNPIPYINVGLGGNIWLGTCADASGNYTIGDIPLNIPVTVVAWGSSCNDPNSPYQSEFWQEVDNEGSATPITLTSGTPDVTGIDFTLAVGGSVSGTVFEGTGTTGLGGIHVSLDFYGNGYGTCTNPDGTFTISGLPYDQPFKASAFSGNGCGTDHYIQEFWDETPWWHEATELTVTSGTPDISGIDFSLEVGGTVTGTVYNFDGSATFDNANINAAEAYGNRNNVGGTGVDENGFWSMALAPGDYIFNAGAGGYALEWYDEAGFYDQNATIVTVTQGAYVNNVDFTLDDGGTISGQTKDASGNPLPYMNVGVDGIWIGNCSDDQGNYTINSVPLDEPVIVAAWGDSCGGTGDFLREYWQEVPDYASATTITLTSGTPDVTGIDFTLDIGGTVSGTVYESTGTTGLGGIWVWAGSQNYGDGTCTNGDGTYLIEGLPYDTDFRVSARSSNCSTDHYMEEFWNERQWYHEADFVTLTSGSPDATGIDFTLELGGTITGTVYNFDGSATVSNGNVCFNYSGGGGAGCTGMDQSGQYSSGLAPGDYIVSAHGSGYALEFYDEAGIYSQNATLVTVTAGAYTPGVDFTLDAGGTISGQTKDESGNPLPYMNVGIADNGVWLGSCSDDNGFYTIQGIPFDTPLKVQARGNSCQGPANYLQEFWQETDDQNSATPVTVTSGSPDATGIDFTLAVGGTISGRVVDSLGNGIPNLSIGTDFLGAADGNGTCTDNDGYYTVEGLPLNLDFKLKAGDQWCSPHNYVREFYDDTYNWSSAQLIMLTDAVPDLTGYDFELDEGGTVSGIITDEGFNPIGGIEVQIDFFEGDFGGYAGTESNGDGTYTITGIPLGINFKVTAGSTPWSTTQGYLAVYYDGTYFDNATVFNLTSGSPDATGVDFALAEGGIITGTVYQANGTTPIDQYGWVEAGGINNGPGGSGRFEPNDGTYALTVPAGDFTVNASGGTYAWEYFSNVIDRDNATIVTVAVGQTVSGIDFSLEPGGTISGTVEDEFGNPLADIPVSMPATPVGNCTDGDGNYELHNIPLDTSGYDVWAGGQNNWCGGSVDYVREFWQETLRDNGTFVTPTTATPIVAGIDFTLELGGTISGNVADDGATPLPDVWVCAMDYAATHFDLGHSWTCGQTEANGDYEIIGVSADNKRLWLFPDWHMRYFWTAGGGTEFYALADIATVGTGYDFVLPEASIISGTVTDGSGNPISGAMVSLADGSYMECTNDAGEYRIRVPVGQHVVTVGEGVCDSATTLHREFFDNARSAVFASPLDVSSLGIEVTGVDFVIDDYPFDVNGDGIVSPVDVVFVVNRIGLVATDNPGADINDDNVIDNADVNAVLAELGQAAP